MVGRKRDWSESEIAQIKDMYEVQGRSPVAIASIMGEQATTLYRAVKYLGLKKPQQPSKPAKVAVETPLQQTIRRMWLAGEALTAIAKACSKQEGRQLNRNVVSGHISRMKLPRRSDEAKVQAAKAASPKKPKPFNIPPKNGLGGPKAAKVGPSSVDTKATFDPLKLDGKFITLENLHHRNMCKYPIGDPSASNFHFCGHATKKSSAYCEAHHSRCYTPTTNQSNVNRDYARNSGINRIG